MGKAGTPSCTDEEFIALFSKSPTVEAVSKHLDCGIRQVFERRRRIEQKHDIRLTAGGVRERQTAEAHSPRVPIEVKNGIVLVGSDAHYQPGRASVAHRAFIHFCKELQPAAVIANGDMFDGARISRHPKIGFLERAPTVKEELEVVGERMDEILQAVQRRCSLHWTLGNHDLRFESMLAANAGEYEGVKGTSLKDHFSGRWKPSWSVFINDTLVVKHRFKGGLHATHGNTLFSGKSMTTGHLHSAKVTPFDDYNGTRYGTDAGCLAEPRSSAFTYLEDNPTNWRSGFVIHTFKDGKLLYPELVLRWDDDHVQFRGALIRV